MASIQIAVDVAYVTKAEFLRRTGMNPSTFDKLKGRGEIPIKPKTGSRTLVMVNMVKWAQQAAMQEV